MLNDKRGDYFATNNISQRHPLVHCPWMQIAVCVGCPMMTMLLFCPAPFASRFPALACDWLLASRRPKAISWTRPDSEWGEERADIESLLATLRGSDLEVSQFLRNRNSRFLFFRELAHWPVLQGVRRSTVILTPHLSWAWVGKSD